MNRNPLKHFILSFSVTLSLSFYQDVNANTAASAEEDLSEKESRPTVTSVETLESLGDDILSKVAGYVSDSNISDLMNFMGVSRKFRNIGLQHRIIPVISAQKAMSLVTAPPELKVFGFDNLLVSQFPQTRRNENGSSDQQLIGSITVLTSRSYLDACKIQASWYPDLKTRLVIDDMTPQDEDEGDGEGGYESAAAAAAGEGNPDQNDESLPTSIVDPDQNDETLPESIPDPDRNDTPEQNTRNDSVFLLSEIWEKELTESDSLFAITKTRRASPEFRLIFDRVFAGLMLSGQGRMMATEIMKKFEFYFEFERFLDFFQSHTVTYIYERLSILSEAGVSERRMNDILGTWKELSNRQIREKFSQYRDVGIIRICKPGGQLPDVILELSRLTEQQSRARLTRFSDLNIIDKCLDGEELRKILKVLNDLNDYDKGEALIDFLNRTGMLNKMTVEDNLYGILYIFSEFIKEQGGAQFNIFDQEEIVKRCRDAIELYHFLWDLWYKKTAQDRKAFCKSWLAEANGNETTESGALESPMSFEAIASHSPKEQQYLDNNDSTPLCFDMIQRLLRKAVLAIGYQ